MSPGAQTYELVAGDNPDHCEVVNGVQRAEPQLKVSAYPHKSTYLAAEGAVHLLPCRCDGDHFDGLLKDSI